MNETTQFLLQLIGPVVLIMGIGLLLNKNYYSKIYNDLDKSPIFMIFASALSLTVGFAMILKHNIWGNAGEIIISLFGWIAIAKGVSLVLMPKGAVSLSKNLISAKYFPLLSGVLALLGAYMTWLGYFV